MHLSKYTVCELLCHWSYQISH